MRDYLYEITHDYDGPIEGIVTYLNEHAKPGDLVAANHEDLPIKWYTGLRTIGSTTGEDFKPALDADWVVMRRPVDSLDMEFSKYLIENLDISKYERINLKSLDIVFENREDPEKHLFRTVVNPRPHVVIFHRTKE